MVMGLSTSRLSWLNKKRKQNNRTSTSSTTSNTTRIRRSTRTIDLLPAEQEQHHHHRRHRRHQQRRHQLQQQQETSQLSLQVQIPPPNPTASTTTSVTKKLLGFDRRNKMGRWSRRPYQEQMWLSGDIDHNNDNHKTRNMTSTGYSTGSTSAGGASFPFSSARLPNEALKKSYATMSCTSKLTTGISSSNTNASASATNSIIKDDCTSCKSTPTAMSRSTLRSSTTQKVNNKKKQSMTMSQPSPLSSSPSPSLSKMKYQLPYSIQFISLVLPTSFPQSIIDSGITRTDITTDHLNDNDNNHNNNGATSKTAQLLKALLSSSSTNAHHDTYDDDGELDTTTMTSTTTSTDMWSVTSGQTTLAKDRIKETIACSMEIKQYLDEMTNNNNNNNDDEDENHYNSMLPAVPNLQHGPVNVDFVLESSEWEIASFVDTFIQLKRFNDVIDIYLTVLEHFQTQFGNVNPMVISTLHNLGVIYVLKGDYARALVYCKEALKRRKQTLGCNHGDLVTSYCELGVIYYAREEFSRGLDALRQALHIVCNSKEYNYPNYKVTFILNNIACLHFACGKSIASIATFEESLDMQRSMMGSTVSNEVSNMLLNMSITLCNAGIVSATQGQDDIASSLVEEGLIVQQSVLHDKHRLVKSTISTLKTMVKHYDDANDDTIHQLCMDQVEISYPQCRNSSDLADDVKNQSLAECSDMLTLGSMQKGELNSQQRVSTAMPYKYLAHQIISEGQSKRHCSWVALDVESSEQKCTDTEEHFNLSESCVMASYKIQQKDVKGTIELFQQFRRSHESKCGDVAIILASVHHILGLIHIYTKNFQSARIEFQAAAKLRESQLDPNHSDVLSSQLKRSIAIMALDDYDKALSILQQILNEVRKRYGYSDHRVSIILNNIGICHYEFGGLLASLKSFEESVEILQEAIQKSSKGDANFAYLSIHLGRSVHNLAFIRFKRKEYDEAILALQISLASYRNALGDKHKTVKRAIEDLAFVMATANCLDSNDTLDRMTEMYIEMLGSKTR